MITGTRRTKLAPKAYRRKSSPRWGNIFLLASMALAIGAGAITARYVPITAIDWRGLVEGRNVQDVWLDALGKNLTTSYQVLVLGVDQQPGQRFRGRTDTIMLLRFDPQGQITLLSVPRDTQVRIPGVGRAKVNSANVYGGIDEVKATMAELLPNVRIDRFVRIDTGGLGAVIDAIGGVEVDVPERMFYEDRTQGLLIDLHPGKQVLNGREAEAFSRYRGGQTADIGRIQRQQILLQAVQERLRSPWTIARLKPIIDTIRSHIDTDLTIDEMIALASFSLNLSPDRVETLTLPGVPRAEFGSSYWIADHHALDSILSKFETR